MTARDPGFAATLARAVRGEVRQQTPLARLSSYRIGGPATVFLPASADDLLAGVEVARAAGVALFPVGLGSNLLFPDEGLDALVIKLGKGLDTLRQEGERWRIGAGLPAPQVARRTAEQGFAGLHLMIGVPGSVGGGVFMNAGCHGGQWADVVRTVTVIGGLGPGSGVRTIPAAEIPFTYRRSGLEGVVVVETEVELRPADPAVLEEEVLKLMAWRQQGTPFNQPCCGSVFKNPAPPAPPGWQRPWTAGSLLEAAGLKGTRVGGAEVSPLHANYFVNTGEATAADVRGLIALARETVRERYGVDLETEVRVL